MAVIVIVMFILFIFILLRPPPRSTRTYTLCPYTTLVRSVIEPVAVQVQRIPRIICVEDIFAPQADAVAIVGKSIAELAVDQRISLLRGAFRVEQVEILLGRETAVHAPDRKSTRLNSSH